MTFVLLAAALNAVTAVGQVVIYNDYSIPKPGKSLSVTPEDLKLSDGYLDLYPDGVQGMSREDLVSLFHFFKSDPDGQKEWKSLQNKALKCIPAWDMRELTDKRYVYSLSNLKPLALLYIFTGNELLSDFIIGHLLKAASLPVQFWVHEELRGFNPEKPLGCIETAYLNQTLGTAIQAVARNMTREQRSAVESAWYEKGYIPALNWMEENPGFVSNFNAVIASGALFAAGYFADTKGREEALRQMRMYLCEAVFPDGSNFEGYDYFSYPAGQILPSLLLLSEDELRKLTEGTGLANSMHWRVSGMIFGKDGKGHPSPLRITWGDNPCGTLMYGRTDQTASLCSIIYGDPVAEWVQQTYRQRESCNIFLLRRRFGNEMPLPQSPEEAGIPLLTCYESGDSYIRSGWTDEDMVLGIKTRNGDREKLQYIHSRPEINSINLGAYGEYFICNAASASYRSPIRKSHDIRSWRANIITVDGQDQLYPFDFFRELGTYGYPDAEIVCARTLPDGRMVLSNEARQAYALPMSKAERTVIYVPEGRYFVVIDKMVPSDGQIHHFDHRLFLFNHDFQTYVRKTGNMLKAERPKADLYIAVDASSQMKYSNKSAYIHGLSGRDYDPKGPYEGKPGSAKGLVWSCEAEALEVCTVLVPQLPDAPAPKIIFGKDCVTVNGVTCETKLNYE